MNIKVVTTKCYYLFKYSKYSSLEHAINAGNHKEAALLAKEVSKLQISTKLSLKELSEKRNNKKVEKIRSVYIS